MQIFCNVPATAVDVSQTDLLCHFVIEPGKKGGQNLSFSGSGVSRQNPFILTYIEGSSRERLTLQHPFQSVMGSLVSFAV